MLITDGAYLFKPNYREHWEGHGKSMYFSLSYKTGNRNETNNCNFRNGTFHFDILQQEQTETKNMKNKLPIGYYLKKTDNLLTEGINNIHKELDITRTDWQILNSINENAKIGRQKIAGLLSEFANKETISEAVATLLNRQLILEEKYFSLTEKGKDLYQTCFQKQKAFRQKAMKNIAEQQYLQTIETLEKIIDNLE